MIITLLSIGVAALHCRTSVTGVYFNIHSSTSWLFDDVKLCNTSVQGL